MRILREKSAVRSPEFVDAMFVVLRTCHVARSIHADEALRTLAIAGSTVLGVPLQVSTNRFVLSTEFLLSWARALAVVAASFRRFLVGGELVASDQSEQ